MGAANPGEPLSGGLSERACRILAGLDAGVIGGILVLIWLSFMARIQGDYWWAKWNVAGALFYGDRVYSMGWGRASLAGAACLLLVYALLGLLFSLLARVRGYGFNLLLGLTIALTWYLAAELFIWSRLNPGAPRYFHAIVMLPANVLFGLALVRFAPRFRRIAAVVGDSTWSGQLFPVPTSVLPEADPPPGPPGPPRPDC
jgi:hypothetical protein